MKVLNRFYQILDLEPGVSPAEIRQAYWDLAKVWHPDRFPHDHRLQLKTQEKLKEINEAYEMLSSYQFNGDAQSYQASAEPKRSQWHRKTAANRGRDPRDTTNAPTGAQGFRQKPRHLFRWVSLSSVILFLLSGFLFSILYANINTTLFNKANELFLMKDNGFFITIVTLYAIIFLYVKEIFE